VLPFRQGRFLLDSRYLRLYFLNIAFGAEATPADGVIVLEKKEDIVGEQALPMRLGSLLADS